MERSRLKLYNTPLHKFAEGSAVTEGVIELIMSFGKNPVKVTTIVNFIIVDQPSFYNAVLGRPTLYAIKAITLIYHYALKFLTKAIVGVL